MLIKIIDNLRKLFLSVLLALLSLVSSVPNVIYAFYNGAEGLYIVLSSKECGSLKASVPTNISLPVELFFFLKNVILYKKQSQ